MYTQGIRLYALCVILFNASRRLITLHVVRKPTEPGKPQKWRITCDYRELNKVIRNHAWAPFPAGSPWHATQIVLVLYWNPLLLRTELIRSIWIYCSTNSSTGNPVRRVECPGPPPDLVPTWALRSLDLDYSHHVHAAGIICNCTAATLWLRRRATTREVERWSSSPCSSARLPPP